MSNRPRHRLSVAVPFLVALGFATAAVAIEQTERFGARNALRILAGGFCAIGLVGRHDEEQQEEMEAAEEQERNASGIGEMTSAAATEAASHLPAALLLLWPTEQTERPLPKWTIPRQQNHMDSKARGKRSPCTTRPERDSDGATALRLAR